MCKRFKNEWFKWSGFIKTSIFAKKTRVQICPVVLKNSFAKQMNKQTNNHFMGMDLFDLNHKKLM